jgi:hypothetical protein
MKVIIPTNRDVVKTIKYYPEAEVFHNNLGVVGARNHIIKNNKGAVLMLDDDMLGYSKKTAPMKYVKCGLAESFDYHLDLMNKFSTPFLGIGSTVSGVRQKREPALFGRAYSAYYIDTDVFNRENLYFEQEAELFEDFEMTLQLFDRGFKPVVSYKYAIEFDHWQKGGVSSARNEDRCLKSCNFILNKWAKYRKFITIVKNRKSLLPEPRFGFKELMRYSGIAS